MITRNFLIFTFLTDLSKVVQSIEKTVIYSYFCTNKTNTVNYMIYFLIKCINVGDIVIYPMGAMFN